MQGGRREALAALAGARALRRLACHLRDGAAPPLRRRRPAHPTPYRWRATAGTRRLSCPPLPLAATGLLPEAADFPDAAFLEFGWGDRTYYPAKKKTLGMTLAAALVPTPAVMHMAGHATAPAGRERRLRGRAGGPERSGIPETGGRNSGDVRAPFRRPGRVRFPRPLPRQPLLSCAGRCFTCSTRATPGRRACCAPAASLSLLPVS